MQDLQQSTLGGSFDYIASGLSQQEVIALQLSAERIRLRLKRTAEDIIAIGQELIEAQRLLAKPGKKGHFSEWLRGEFDMTRMTAYQFIHVAERFGDNSKNYLQLPVSILYQLAAPSTPESVVEEVTAGEVPATTAEVKKAIAAAKKAEAEAEAARKQSQAAQQQLLTAQAEAERIRANLTAAEQRAQKAESAIEGIEAELTAAREQQETITITDPAQQEQIEELETEVTRLARQRDAAYEEIKGLQRRLREQAEQANSDEGGVIVDALATMPLMPETGVAFAKLLDKMAALLIEDWQVEEWLNQASPDLRTYCDQTLTRVGVLVEHIQNIISARAAVRVLRRN